VVKVEDPRLALLTEHFKPHKVTPVHVQYLDIAGLTGEGKPGHTIGDKVLSHIRPMDALLHCVRFFDSPILGPPNALKDFMSVDEEMILSDLDIVEKRLERVNKDLARGKKELSEERGLLLEARAVLDDGKPLRNSPSLADADKLRGFSFLSAKPQLVLINAGDDKSREEITAVAGVISEALGDNARVAIDWLYADTEAEIARLSPEDAAEFLSEMRFEAAAKQRVVEKSFALLNLIVFFTCGDPEVRAWPLERGLTAVKAAGTVHSDMERGFIRAEVVGYEDFTRTGSMAAAHKAGKVRLEGKEYEIRDGDIVLFRFNV
jgi:ribosome-binding ATPase